jgi:hypothetical protein
MSSRFICAALVAVVCAGPGFAVIQRMAPLKDVIAAETSIFVAKVERQDPSPATMVLAVSADLKGKTRQRKMAVQLAGDAEAQKTKQSAQLLDRLAPNLELVIFASTRGSRITMFAFTNGTWFQMTADSRTDESSTVAFTHFEPYLRRTFKGTTAELKQAVVDGLSGKTEPPPPDPKEPPGIGPPVKK